MYDKKKHWFYGWIRYQTGAGDSLIFGRSSLLSSTEYNINQVFTTHSVAMGAVDSAAQNGKAKN